jgi:hypothetical protein
MASGVHPALPTPPHPRQPAFIGGVAWCLMIASAGAIALAQVGRWHTLGGLGGVSLTPGSALVMAFAAAIVLVLGAILRSRAGAPVPADRIVVVSLVVAFAVGLFAQQRLGARLQSDGFYYYAYLRSLWFDGDVDFTNDYRLLGLGDKAHLIPPTQTGHAQSAWTIGPAIVWTPFFGVGHVVAIRLKTTNTELATDGTSFPYRQAVCVAGLFYGLLGVWFCYRLASLFFSRGLAAVAASTTIAGSFMLWYVVKEPTMTHAPSMAAVAAFAYVWARTLQRRTTAGWIGLGLLAGLMTTIRWQNAIFTILPAIDSGVGLMEAWRRRDRELAVRVIRGGLAFAMAAFVGFLPQMLAWKAIYGHYLAISPVGPEIRWRAPEVQDILWSSRNGLFSTSPVLYLAAIGLLVFARSARRVGVAVLVTFAVMVYFNASIQDWWGSAGFGMRRFDGLIPLLTLGMGSFAGAAARAISLRPRVAVAASLLGLVVWNLTLMGAALGGDMRLGEPASFAELGAAQVRLAHRWFGYPFSYPANLVYALRNGVPPWRYDRLRPSRFLGDPYPSYGRINLGTCDEAVIGAGWHAPEQDGPTRFRWAEPQAELFVALDRAADLMIQIRLKPLEFPGAPAQRVLVRVNETSHGPFEVPPGWAVTEFVAGRECWRAGVNKAVLIFDGGHRPADVGLGDDSRTLSAAVDFFRVRLPR